MALDTSDARRSISPALSGRSSPVPRASRKAEDESHFKDKAVRRYAAGIERALSSFDAAQQEWADYIAFLARLSKAIQLPPPNLDALPHASTVSLRLSQCLNPALPSGVHQKALEVYATILAFLGEDVLGRSLHVYLPSLLPVLSFASLSVRPLYYALFENHVLKLGATVLRPATKSLILCLLPGIEDETSEDFERAFRIIDGLRTASAQDLPNETGEPEVQDGYFWQCFFLAVITNPSRRLGALAYLSRRLPSFSSAKDVVIESNGAHPAVLSLPPTAEAVITPEPGLLVRCFAVALQDSQVLVQRGFLDLLVTHVPLHSALFQQRLEAADIDLVITAAVSAVLRRDMSLNRRLWSWFLGPDPSAADSEDGPPSPIDSKHHQPGGTSQLQAAYFQAYGAASLERSLFAMLKRPSSNSSDVARPFRICLSLMDRWEVGGIIVPRVLRLALDSVFEYSLVGTQNQVDEVVRSASLFFNGVESSLIWSRLVEVLLSALENATTDPAGSNRDVLFLQFVVERFDIREEEMLVQHVPNTLLILFSQVSKMLRSDHSSRAPFLPGVLMLARHLFRTLPGRVFRSSRDTNDTYQENRSWIPDKADAFVKATIDHYVRLEEESSWHNPGPDVVSDHVVFFLADIIKTLLGARAMARELSMVSDMLASIIAEMTNSEAFRNAAMYEAFKTVLMKDPGEDRSNFLVVSSIMSVITTTSASSRSSPYFSQEQISDLQADILGHIWLHLSPFRPRYHVEAVRLIWQLERLTRSEHQVEARLAMLVSKQSILDGTETACRLCVLWEHTMHSFPLKVEGQAGGMTRRTSAMHAYTAFDIDIDPEKVLTRPLLLLLDKFQMEGTGASDVIRSWLQTLPSLDRVFHILLSHLQLDLNTYSNRSSKSASKRVFRDAEQCLQDAVFYLRHIRNIIRHASLHTWLVLIDLRMDFSTPKDNSQTTSGLEFLALLCLRVLAIHGDCDMSSLHHASLTILQALLESPQASALRDLRIEDTLIDLLTRSLSSPIGSLQTVYLQAISTALEVRAKTISNDMSQGRQGSTSTPIADLVEHNGYHSPRTSTAPPLELLNCLRVGLSSSSARLFLDHWVDFLDKVLPLYADAVFASLLPLVECICTQVAKAFQYLKDIAQGDIEQQDGVPISALSALLHGLELVLAYVHRLFQGEAVSSPVAKPTDYTPSFFGNIMPGAFAADTPPTKTSRINSRLTMILSFQDAVRTCFSIWTWASQGGTSGRLEPSCAATTSLHAIKLRNKTRKILENLFAAEELECLETLALIWSRPKSGQASEASAVFSLLLVLDGSRPKNTIPVIINALYSRTNIEALDLGRRSSLTSDLATTEIVAFMLSYTRAIEDDATDEIWSECTIFLRDVLSNPLPHRQILPGLLEFTVLLAEKIEHTNFGDLRKMHRDLADIFIRLLTATFTARPVSSIFESSHASGANDLISSLLYVTPKLQTILQGQDRSLNAVDIMSRSIIGPSIHAKSFPENITIEHLRLFESIAQQGATARSWKKDLTDAFNNPRLLTSPIQLMEDGWLPLLRKWTLSDRERMPELLSRLTSPSTAGIMFGVGANAARMEADRRTQLTLRRVVLLLLACEQDTFMGNLDSILNWLVDLCTANVSSSPSSITRAEVFMVFRALILSFSSAHLSAIWPTLNTALQAAIISCHPAGQEQETYGNVSLLQACNLLDLLMTIEPDEFQLHEWLYITNTIDAVYRPAAFDPVALTDEVAEALGGDYTEPSSYALRSTSSTPSSTGGYRQPFFSSATLDGADVKAMARDDFVRTVLQPFLSQLSMYVYEGVYNLGTPDVQSCRRRLLEDVLDESTMA